MANMGTASRARAASCTCARRSASVCHSATAEPVQAPCMRASTRPSQPEATRALVHRHMHPGLRGARACVTRVAVSTLGHRAGCRRSVRARGLRSTVLVPASMLPEARDFTQTHNMSDGSRGGSRRCCSVTAATLAGERIPTLEQVLREFGDRAHIHLVRA